MPEYKLLARSSTGSQVLRRHNRLLLAIGCILLPLDSGRLRQLFRVTKRLQRQFDDYQQDHCVLINYEMIAFRFTRSQLDDFVSLLDNAITNDKTDEATSLYADCTEPACPAPEPTIPCPPDVPLYSRN